MGRRTVRLVAALAVVAAAVQGVAAPASADDGYSSWTMRSEPGDFVGSGQTWAYTTDNATIRTEGDASQVTLFLSHYDDLVWIAEFAAPVGEELTAGRTYPAVYLPQPTPETATMYVHGDGNGCDGGHGEFTVDEAAYDDAGELARFAVRFEQHCDGDEAALLGSIAWQALEPARPLPPAAAEPVTDLSATAGLDLALLTWANPGSDRFVTTEVRVARGLVPPATLGEGREAYSGRREGLLLRELWQGRDFAVSVFTTGPDGSVAGPVSRRLRGTRLSLVERPRPGVGKGLVIRLRDLAGRGVRDAHVDLYQRRPRSDTWRRVSGWETNRRGQAVRDWVNFRTRWYRAVFDGAGRHLGSVSSEIRVRGERRHRARR